MPRSHTDSTDKIITTGADFVFDTRKPDTLLAKLESMHHDITPSHFAKPPFTASPLITDTLNGRTRAFIKIQDGCDRYCTYCIVPYVRGPVVSRSLSDIIQDARAHVAQGVQEIVLTGIQVAAYGNITDSGYITLPELIKKLSDIPKRLRLSSIDPWAVDDAFLEAVAESSTLCSHFHLSLQSGCDKTLERMNRRYTTADYASAASKLMTLRQDAALTTDVLVGFPGETDEDFNNCLHFVEKMAFAQIHVFEYSPREGTPAAKMPNQVSSHVKSARGKAMRDMAKSLQQQFLNAQIGKTTQVLFETMRQGHTDNYCIIEVSTEATQDQNLINTIQNVQITAATDNKLIGNLLNR